MEKQKCLIDLTGKMNNSMAKNISKAHKQMENMDEEKSWLNFFEELNNRHRNKCSIVLRM